MSSRRTFIKELSLSSAALAIGVHKAAPAPGGPYLATGIKIGEVSGHSAIVWARLTQMPERIPDSGPRPVILYRNDDTGIFELKGAKEARPDRVPRVAFPAGAGPAQLAGAAAPGDGELRVCWRRQGEKEWASLPWASAGPEHDGIRQFRLPGLAPGHAYQLRVEARPRGASEASAIEEGGFRTAPPADAVVPVRFAAVTCQEYHDRDYGSLGFRVYPSILKTAPDFFVHTGDVVYYDQEAKSLPLARWHWERIYGFPTLREFHRQVSSYFMKDDHDTWMNDCYPALKTRFMGDFTFRQGQQLFLEQVPMGSRTYRTQRWGKDLQVWFMEVRDFRSPDRAPDGPAKTIWGSEQIAWFKETIQASDATFKVVISPTPIVGPDRPQKVDNHANAVFHHEGEMLRRFIATQPNTHIINGDRHWQYASRDPETGLLEFSCGPVSDEHAGGWSAGDVRPGEMFLRVKGGFLSVAVRREGPQPLITFTHHAVDGTVVHEYTQYASGRY